MTLGLNDLFGPTLSLAVGLMAAATLAGEAHAEASKICINRYVSAGVIDDIISGLSDGLDDAGVSRDGVVIQNPEADAATQQTLAQGFVSDGCDVIVGIATPGAQVFRRLTDTIPVVFIGSSTPVEAGLVNSFETPGTNFTGVADPAPVEDDIDAMLKVMPGIKAVGVIYKAGDPAGDFLGNRSIAHLKSLGVEPVVAVIANAGEATQAAQSLVGRVDAVHVPGDSTTMSAIPAILKVADDAKLPVFGGLSEAVSQGALLSGSYSYVEVGYLAADLIKRVLNGEDPAGISVVVPKAAGFEVNTTKADMLGLAIPAEILDNATATY